MKNVQELMDAVTGVIEQVKAQAVEQKQPMDNQKSNLDVMITNYEKNGKVNQYLYDGIPDADARLFKSIAVTLPDHMISDEEIESIYNTVSTIMLPADIINAASKGTQFSDISEVYFWRNALIENFKIKATIALEWSLGATIKALNGVFGIEKDIYNPYWLNRFTEFSHYCANQYLISEEAMIADAHTIATYLVNSYIDYRNGEFIDPDSYIELVSKSTQSIFACLKVIAQFAVMYSHLGTCLNNDIPEEIARQILPGGYYDFRYPLNHKANYNPEEVDYDQKNPRKFYIILGKDDQE